MVSRLRRLGGRSLRAIGRSVRRTEIWILRRPPRLPRQPWLFRERAARLLTDTVIRYWMALVGNDLERGYGAYLDAAGRVPQPPALHAISIARMLWFYSTLAASTYSEPMMHRAAQAGFDILRTRLWDDRRGGIRERADATDAKGTNKHLYCQVMALDAMVAYRALTGSDEARRLVHDLLEIMDRRFRDDAGGYLESLSADWGRVKWGEGLVTRDPELKTAATHLNAVHILANVHKAGLADLAEPIKELITILEGPVRLKPSGQMGERFHRDWTPADATSTVGYGHDLEAIWMIRGARASLGLELEPAGMSYRDQFARTARWGWDSPRGGFYFAGPAGNPAANIDKHWWVQAEALVACLTMYEATGASVYLGYFHKTLQWIEKRQADWVDGEWHERIDVLGRPQGRKAWEWKTGYHTARSLLIVLDQLDRMNGAKGQ